MVWFPVERQAVSLDFANTRYLLNGVLTDGLAQPGGPAGWAAALGLPPAAATPELIGLRDAIRLVFRAAVDAVGPPGPAREIVNQAARAAPAWPELDSDGTTSTARQGADQATNLRAHLAADAITVLTGPARKLLRACPAAGCQGFYLQDHPRRGFCSPRCATRTRVARHYQRRHARPEQPGPFSGGGPRGG
jgi:predicted RNA-binding Zn ribbon-like protein